MITLVHCTINQCKDEDVKNYLNLLPPFMRYEVMAYRNVNDQKSRLIARLMLLHSMKETGMENYITNWEKDSNMKPFIRQWDNFNISHAGERVVLAYAKQPIGVDIEKMIPINYTELMGHFHPQEKDHILASANPLNTFYELWVKKEALLKGLGIGIINDLEQYNCTGKSINAEQHRWYFHEVQLDPEYSCFLCSCVKEKEITIKPFFHE